MQNLNSINTTVLVLTGIIALLIFLLNYVGSKAHERKHEIEQLKFENQVYSSELNIVKEKLKLVEQLDQIGGYSSFKVQVPVKIAAPLALLITQYKKIEAVELIDGNEQLINFIELMANDLTKENYRLRHGKADNEDVLSAAAVVGAYVLRFLTDFKEVKHEKV
jgi:hypothetical protein